MKTLFISIGILTSILVTSQIYLAMAQIETQKYQIIKSEKDFEIRFYPAATMATISMDAKTYKELSFPGFRKLAGYIFGGNESNSSIAMTSPVRMDINDSKSTMSFVMPSAYTKDNLPKPNDANVSIQNSEEEYVAAIKFGGYANDESIKKYAEKLKKSLAVIGIKPLGNYQFLGYNAPYQFWNRKNEIIIKIEYSK